MHQGNYFSGEKKKNFSTFCKNDAKNLIKNIDTGGTDTIQWYLWVLHCMFVSDTPIHSMICDTWQYTILHFRIWTPTPHIILSPPQNKGLTVPILRSSNQTSE